MWLTYKKKNYFLLYVYVKTAIFRVLNCKFALYNSRSYKRITDAIDYEEFFVRQFRAFDRSRRSVRSIMVSFSICISPTNAPISLVPPRFNNITHCCERGMHACKFATVFRQFRGYEPDALLPLLCHKIATGYSVISIIDVNTFFSRATLIYTHETFWQRKGMQCFFNNTYFLYCHITSCVSLTIFGDIWSRFYVERY